MRRFAVSVFVASLALVGARSSTGIAQDATPAAAPNVTVGQLAPIGEPFQAGPGVELEFLGEGQTDQASGQNLVLYRVIFDGGEFPGHIHPGATVLTVESGTFGWTLLTGTVTVLRPGTPPEEVTEPGTELVLSPGQGLAYNADVVHSARDVGDEPAVVLATSLFETGQPFVTMTDDQGAPMAMDAATPAP